MTEVGLERILAGLDRQAAETGAEATAGPEPSPTPTKTLASVVGPRRTPLNKSVIYCGRTLLSALS